MTTILSDFNLVRVKPLLATVLERQSDQELWDQVYKVVAELSSGPKTPPHIPFSQTLDTPIKSTSSSQRGSEQTHDDLDLRILQEINGCVYRDTEGFYEKHFEGKEWSAESDKIAERADPQIIEGRWTSYPEPPVQDAFLAWFDNFQSKYLQGGRSTFYSSPNRPLAGSACKRKPDIFLVSPSAPKNDGRYSWADVLVIGELKQSVIRGKSKEELVFFCGNAREVFASQPTRRFLHGFFIRGSLMELWLFDRSGLYSCKTFDIHQDPRRFIKIMAGYSQMSDQELGINTYIKKDGMGKYITCKEAEEEEERLYLEEKPIAYQRAIISRGTTCFRAKRQGSDRWEYVVKFAWRSDKRRAEGELLKLAKERNVWGVAKLFSHQDLDSVADIRQGLQFGKPQAFRSGDLDSISNSHSKTQTGLATPTTSSGQKRKDYGEGSPAPPAKKSKSGEGYPAPPAPPAKKSKSGEGSPAPPAKKYKSGSRKRSTAKSPLSRQVNSKDTDADAGADAGKDTLNTNSLITPEVQNGSFENRIFSCLIISPPGRAVHRFTSTTELLQAYRDFVKAHRSLYYDGEILHRDISENNIIIIDTEVDSDPRGMLIDLDLAKELKGGPSGARHRTGTMEFMAIEVLLGRPHTYRHDLESFFYVFLWVIIEHQLNGTVLPWGSQLRDWYSGSYNQVANMKRGHMDKQGFESILAEFPDGLKDCIQIWLGLVTELCVAAVAVVLVGITVGVRNSPTAEFLGVSLLSIVSFTANLGDLGPFVTPGTIRENIDPLNTLSDDELVGVLKDVCLWDALEGGAGGGVNGRLQADAKKTTFSTGQLQLLSLARTMAQWGKIIAVDEVASNLDTETDGLIREIIQTKQAITTPLLQ
ncbi:hypothetical protein VM1G_03803 [Cytospora mali]|uniref:Protein kinase domain-containing protein n=1 Tax=Cytospora mali TaxID=578113 RepID=A0A194VXQ4_CYTMA|nr:hypothetical protein VM1G_03803 [Valsa mali]